MRAPPGAVGAAQSQPEHLNRESTPTLHSEHDEAWRYCATRRRRVQTLFTRRSSRTLLPDHRRDDPLGQRVVDALHGYRRPTGVLGG